MTATALSLKQAAEQTGKSKSTIFRACKAGRVSYSRGEDGTFAIEAAELFRVFPPLSGTQRDDAVQDTPDGAPCNAPATPENDGMSKALQAQIEALREMLDDKNRQIEDLRTDRDRWAAQAERLALPAPESGAGERDATEPLTRGLWGRWRRRAA